MIAYLYMRKEVPKEKEKNQEVLKSIMYFHFILTFQTKNSFLKNIHTYIQ